MQGKKRKVVQAVSYELVALLFITPAMAWVFEGGMVLSGALALALCLVAMVWNMVFNSLFEAWEKRRRNPRRTLSRRVLHAVTFELGLLLMTVPMLVWALNIGWWQALATDFSLMLFFLLYAFVFQWGFDLLFGVPSATLVKTTA
ncbi:PACE efflux transporter [Pseudomonas turukhanskensis]|uniref:Membrane protein n=1 Tax=Pseudomonas turukhanskensis TaxID=1806536 RepID=A0A9W6K5H8_9PSED|nr:PACE efflux transporter [Pseudomonas turukhanskensis]GLK87874.1 membrane protein [Pseudomonas turukhanskensis]